MRIKIAVVLVVTIAFLVGVLWGIDVEHALEALSQVSWWRLLPMCALYMTAHMLRTWRLRLLLNQPIRYWRLFSINSVGFLAINVIPLRLGEMVRPYLLTEREGIPFGRGMAAIVLERLLDMLMLLGMLMGLTLLVELPPGGLVIDTEGGGVDVIAAGQQFAGGIVVLGVLVGTALVAIGEPATQLIEKLPMGTLIAGFVRKFRDGFGELIKAPARLALLLAISASIWGVTIGAVAVVMSAFPGIPVSLSAAWSTWSITLSGMVALPTPGFFGAYELFCSTALRLWGVHEDIARTFAVVLHLGMFSFTVSIGGLCLLIEGLSLRDLVRTVPQVKAQDG
ncbi:MAG: lysylphosphatidylglycerol synthase transmembrane domain-containing protein [Myxococcota bacterium]|nr:lysylphosphatidylglycerol synthase transmembrane domain-containing protein [Myxococcota bacterium]